MPASGAPQRLTRSADFDRVYRRGRSAHHRLLVAYTFDRPETVADPGEDPAARAGITVARRIGGAVVRNRLKRQLRDALRRGAAAAVPPTADVVLVARPGLAEAAERNGMDWLVELVGETLGRTVTARSSS